MERIRKGSCSGNEAALLKAAAWAWYEHGTGLEGKSLQEFDVGRSFHDPKPSRFKLEAKKLAKQGSSSEEGFSPRTIPIVQTDDHSLLDRYEIESISRRLDQLIESGGDKSKVYNKGSLVGDRLAEQYDQDDSDYPGYSGKCSTARKVQDPTSAVGDHRRKECVALSDGDYTNHRRKTKSNFRGFWQRHAVICGSTTHKDVILGTRTFVHSRERPQYLEKRKVYSPGPVVKLANCRPKATGRHTRLVIN